MIRTLTLTLLLCSSAAALAADGQERLSHGAQLHDRYCLSCHDSTVYSRENRIMRSYQMLQQQIARCRNNLGFTLRDDEADALLLYLNTTYYHFPPNGDPVPRH